MTGSAITDAASWSYGLALLCYGLFALRVVIGWRGSARATLLAAALVSSAVWAGGALWLVRTSTPMATLTMQAGDLLRYGLWLAFIAHLWRGPQADATAPSRVGAARLGAALALLVLAGLFLVDTAGLTGALGTSVARAMIGLQLGLAVVGLVMLEQLMRRAHAQVRWSLRPLAVALGGLFGYDLLMYADAMLFSGLDVDFWAARGIAHAIVIPLFAVATARNSGWTVDLHMSRNAVFHSTALLLCGGFLLAVAGAGYLVRYLGGSLARAIQVELLFAAVVGVVLVATSGRFRSTLRVFVSKHFFSYRYDYREEWLRFTRTLSSQGGSQSLHERAIVAMCALVESPGGLLWIDEDGGGFRNASRFNVAAHDGVEPSDGALATFLARTGWIVDLDEYARDRAQYPGVTLPAWLTAIPNAWLVVPLLSGDDLVGFVLLMTARAPVKVDWEVRDLLKTASRQAASYIAHARATGALLESRKFDAFNRMSAFVVHDLKNLVAQQSLLLRNAERHRDNPEFQADMLSTVRHVVERMNLLMMQLRAGATPVAKPHAVALGPLVRRVSAAKADPTRPFELDIATDVWAAAHAERLEHVIAHLIQNALDASAPGGPITLRVLRDRDQGVVEVHDHGKGMTAAFIRERLGKPFETTKVNGMGIGVYESSQYLASVGGRLDVDSAPERGTCVRVRLPVSEALAAHAAQPEAA